MRHGQMRRCQHGGQGKHAGKQPDGFCQNACAQKGGRCGPLHTAAKPLAQIVIGAQHAPGTIKRQEFPGDDGTSQQITQSQPHKHHATTEGDTRNTDNRQGRCFGGHHGKAQRPPWQVMPAFKIRGGGGLTPRKSDGQQRHACQIGQHDSQVEHGHGWQVFTAVSPLTAALIMRTSGRRDNRARTIACVNFVVAC